VLRDILLDELEQDVGHVLAAGSGGRLEGVVEADFNVQIHAFDLRFFRFEGSFHELLLTSLQK
jgi:hypothetical protein